VRLACWSRPPLPNCTARACARCDCSPSSAMAIYAHPDDADVAAGGLMAQWASDGCAVHLVVMCDGAKGSHGPKAIVSRYAETREEELQFAADLLGAHVRARFRLARRRSGERREAPRELVGLVRKHRPKSCSDPIPPRPSSAGSTSTIAIIARPVGPCSTPWRRPRPCRSTFPDRVLLTRSAAAAQWHPRTRRRRGRLAHHRHQGEGGAGARVAIGRRRGRHS
jgi:hypothetical protein